MHGTPFIELLFIILWAGKRKCSTFLLFLCDLFLTYLARWRKNDQSLNLIINFILILLTTVMDGLIQLALLRFAIIIVCTKVICLYLCNVVVNMMIGISCHDQFACLLLVIHFQIRSVYDNHSRFDRISMLLVYLQNKIITTTKKTISAVQMPYKHTKAFKFYRLFNGQTGRRTDGRTLTDGCVAPSP